MTATALEAPASVRQPQQKVSIPAAQQPCDSIQSSVGHVNTYMRMHKGVSRQAKSAVAWAGSGMGNAKKRVGKKLRECLFALLRPLRVATLKQGR